MEFCSGKPKSVVKQSTLMLVCSQCNQKLGTFYIGCLLCKKLHTAASAATGLLLLLPCPVETAGKVLLSVASSSSFVSSIMRSRLSCCQERLQNIFFIIKFSANWGQNPYLCARKCKIVYNV